MVFEAYLALKGAFQTLQEKEEKEKEKAKKKKEKKKKKPPR